jgi:hypothetical protein
MAYTIFDYVDNATPDYDATLTVDPQEVMFVSGEKDIEIHKAHGRAEERIILSSDSRFGVKLQWRYLREGDHSTVFDWYHDSAKGCGQARSFKWDPPAQYDAHIYVVRFDCRWESFLQNYQNYGIASLLLYVLGRIAE